ncbi:hypothetical protein [Actinomadura terrae]|uniref:hypothetical protein n=1 Tax=Actinomadura terrae TaxID=604353 RepID=UPI001FA6E92E|nr:hypothetical protein [Actinomadura terrae]
MTYLLVVQDDSWSVQRESLIEKIASRWTEAQIGGPADRSDPVLDVTWNYGQGDAEVEGSMHESGQCVYLDGQEGAVADFVAWFRGLIPPQIELVLCDDTYSFDAVIQAGSDVDHIRRLFPDGG